MIEPAVMFLLGGLTGAAVAAATARVVVRRSLGKVRSAERRARSAERLAELGAMTSGLAHEIKNPLSTIGLNAQLLEEGIAELPIGEDDKGRLARRMGSLSREVERLRGILQDFLEYAGELRLDPRPADLNAVVDELADFFMPQAERQGVRIRTDRVAGALPVSLDVARIKQALLNLMLNAVQAMSAPAAGANGAKELILKTQGGVDPDGTQTAIVHVIDTGPGIDPAALPKIFTPYYTTKAGGTGLGLPTTRRIIEAHQGRLDVHTEPGRGTDFIVTLPAE